MLKCDDLSFQWLSYDRAAVFNEVLEQPYGFDVILQLKQICELVVKENFVVLSKLIP